MMSFLPALEGLFAPLFDAWKSDGMASVTDR
jgi:hypothetical protein